MDTKQILILIGFAIYYLIRSSGSKQKDQKAAPKKRPQKRNPAAPQRSIEDILRDLAGEKESKAEKTITFEPDEPVVEIPTEIQPRRPHPPATPHKRIEVEHDEEEDHGFDLRQAIINDAILNRPYQ